jgi:hypothetical protein
MQTITIPPAALPRGYYAAHVATCGHVPGTLSGAALKGKAKKYGMWYEVQRRRTASALAPYGVRTGLALVNSRWSRVWTDTSGQPVRVEVAE